MNKEFIFKRIDETISNDWDNFLIQEKVSTPFQSSKYCICFANDKNFKSSGKAFYFGDKIIGGYVVYKNSEFGFPLSYILSRALCIGGPVISQDYIDYQSIIIDKLKNEFKYESLYLEVWNMQENFIKINDNDFKFSEHLNFFISLDRTKEELLKSISESTRKKIKKSIKDIELKEVETEEQLKILFNLVNENYQLLKIPLLPFEVFEQLYNDGDSLLFLAKYHEEYIAARVVIKNKTELYDWYAGRNDKYEEIPANEFLVWKVLEYGINNQFKLFNFGGAGKPNKKYGPREFKRRFGGELVNYGRFKKVNNMVINYFIDKYLALKSNYENN